MALYGEPRGALEKLKESNAAKLELETKKMEERIRSLKEKMMKEKEERERLGGTRWTSGRTGPLTKNIQKYPGSKKMNPNGSVSKSPRKIKLLTDVPVDSYIRKPPAVAANEGSINPCGQCDKISSVWFCHECSEKYCDACFNQFHLKGALRKHTKTRVEDEATKQSEQERTSGTTARQEGAIFKSYGATTETPVLRNEHMNGLSLLNGNYNEEESANSFAQALQEWRNQNKAAKINQENPPVSCTDTSCGTSMESANQDDKKELKIKFNSSISYGDRLYLKKNRETNLACPGLMDKVNGNDKKGERKANQSEMFKDDKRPAFELEEKDSNESVDNFAPNYREMIQNMTAVKSKSNNSGSDHMPSQNALFVEEISPVEIDTHYDQGSSCIIDECEKEETNQSRPTSRHGAITICEMYSSKNHEQESEQTAHHLGAHNYVSPSITSKPFFLKPTGKVVKKQPVRTKSAGHKKTPRKEEQRKELANKNLLEMSAQMKRQHSEEKHYSINESSQSPVRQSNKSSKKQLPLKKNGRETMPSTNHISPRPPSNASSNKNKTRIPVRQAWKPKPSHKELSSFFLAGVDEDSETLKQNEEEHSERSLSNPVTNLGRGSLSSTWNPVESYPHISTPDSIDMSPDVEILRDEKQKYYETPDRGSFTFIDKFEEVEEQLERRISKDSIKHNSSKEEDEVLELTALDDFGTGNQDDDDLATLNDLAWELESSTGRLTRCEDDFHFVSDDDSIEDKDAGSGLTTPCTLDRSFRESIMDDFEEMERKFMEEEF